MRLLRLLAPLLVVPLAAAAAKELDHDVAAGRR
jgi:hypothetical protein